MSIEIEIEAPKPHVIQFIRLSKKSEVYYGSWKQKTYLCKKCSAVVVSMTGHAMYHQKELQMLIDIAHKVIPLEEAQAISYQPVEINPLQRSELTS